jgi:hypothetical protein
MDVSRSKDVDHAHALPTPTCRSRRGTLAAIGRFARHFGEMVVAMLIGMQLMMVGETVLDTPPGDNTLLGGYAYMGLAMSIPMVLWMRGMGHPWRDCAERIAGPNETRIP